MIKLIPKHLNAGNITKLDYYQYYPDQLPRLIIPDVPIQPTQHPDDSGIFLVSREDLRKRALENKILAKLFQDSEYHAQHNRNKEEDFKRREKQKQDAQNFILSEIKTPPSLNQLRSIVASLNKNGVTGFGDLGNWLQQASDKLYEDTVEKLYPYKLMAEASITGAELLSGLYGLTRGGAHLNSFLAKQADKRAGLLAGLQSTKALRAANFAEKMDKGQTAMSGLGTAADVGLLISGDHSWVNNAEIAGGAAGVVGGTNWFRNTRFFGRYGNMFDNVLDGAGYLAAGYDVVNDGNKILNTLIDWATNPANKPDY